MNKVSKFESNAITLTSIFGKKNIFFGSVLPEHNQRVNNRVILHATSSDSERDTKINHLKYSFSQCLVLSTDK